MELISSAYKLVRDILKVKEKEEVVITVDSLGD